MKDELGFFGRCKRAVSDFFYDAKVDLHQIMNPEGKKKEYTSVQLKNIKKSSRRKQLLCIWSVLIIPLINLAIFWAYGTAQSIPIAFEHYLPSGKVYDFFNFEYIWSQIVSGQSIFKESLLNSLKYWSFSMLVMTPVAYFMAFFLYKKICGYKFFRYVFFFPTIISAVIIASFFKYLVGPNGQIQEIVRIVFGKEDVLLLADSRTAFGTLLFYNFYTGLAGNMIYYIAAFARVPEEVIEAGRLDGLGILGEVRYITFPITLPFFGTMMLFQVTGILNCGGAALLLTGGAYGTYDLNFYEYILTTSGKLSDQGLAGAIGLMKGLVVLPLALTVNHFVSKIEAVEF